MNSFRFFDFVFAFLGILILSPLFILLFIAGLFDTGSPLFFQERVGRNKRPFNLVKFRTMSINTPSRASHLTDTSHITRFGIFLRRSKLDELPQLWNVLMGSMSIVGPRPCLFNQTELINERQRLKIFRVQPGITGLAQIRKIDMSTPALLAKTEAEMLKNYGLGQYFKYIFLTVFGKGRGDAANK